MSEDGNFLSRWSRKKRETVELQPSTAAATAEDAAPKVKESVTAAGDAKAVKREADGSKFDLASLPSIESIGPDTDIRQFLRAGVPAELTRAALRRAWSSDPAIRDYIGLSENSWDFNAKTGNYGFDLSDPGLDVKRLAEEMFGVTRELGEQKSAETVPPSTDDAPAESPVARERPELAAGLSDHDLLKSNADAVPEDTDREPEQRLLAVQENSDGAVQQSREPEADPRPIRKRHGGALPS